MRRPPVAGLAAQVGIFVACLPAGRQAFFLSRAQPGAPNFMFIKILYKNLLIFPEKVYIICLALKRSEC